jgi:hypothetical protein
MDTVKAPVLDEQPSPSQVDRAEAVAALERVLGSKAFHGSARCQQFMRFVVERTLDGDAASIKERTIAVEVFGRPADYESSEDSIVRVKAGEIRRRLRQYYESEGLQESIVITLPRGGYVPNFETRNVDAAPMEEETAEVPVAETVAETRIPKRVWIRWAGLGFACLAALTVLLAMLPEKSTVHTVWEPMLRGREPLLIYVPVPNSYNLRSRISSTVDRTQPFEGRMSIAMDKVGLGAAAGAASVAAFCARQDHPYRLKFGQELHFSDLRAQPAILLGAFSSQWGPRMSQGHRFELRAAQSCEEPSNGNCIFDTEKGASWYAIERDGMGGAKKDVAIAARIRHRQTGMPLMIAAGITTYGTQGAAEFLLSEDRLAELKHKASDAWNNQNFQAVIEVPVVEGSPAQPRLLAWHFW